MRITRGASPVPGSGRSGEAVLGTANPEDLARGGENGLGHLEPGRVAFDEAARPTRLVGPASAAAEVAGVEAQAVDDHERMAGAGVDRHPLAAPRRTPPHEAG